MQVRVDGGLTAWCAQHDEGTLEPRGARTYEHPSLSGMETVGIVRFLMARATPADARLAPAIDAAVAWLDAAKLTGVRLQEQSAPSTPRGWDRVLIARPAAPPLWARFYEIGTNRPIYSGRDGVIRYRLDEIEYERRTGYAWVGDWPRTLVEREYPAWQARR
jgi:PelA/Pel-15E family pectate lyase